MLRWHIQLVTFCQCWNSNAVLSVGNTPNVVMQTGSDQHQQAQAHVLGWKQDKALTICRQSPATSIGMETSYWSYGAKLELATLAASLMLRYALQIKSACQFTELGDPCRAQRHQRQVVMQGRYTKALHEHQLSLPNLHISCCLSADEPECHGNVHCIATCIIFGVLTFWPGILQA